MTSRVLILVAVVVCALDAACGRTVVAYENSDKTVAETAPKVHVGTDGVSASIGGYSASAGLGGSVGGSQGTSGVLFAKAGTPDGTGASAGLGGTVNSEGQAQGGLNAGASTGSGGSLPTHTVTTIHKVKPVGSPQLYNDIFNIPTSILGAVNRLLNNGVSHVLRAGGSGSGGGAHAGASAGTATGSDAGVGTRIGVGAYAQTGSGSTSGNTGSSVSVSKDVSTGFFNDIFNIPITALNAVNQLLNNKSSNNGK